MNCEFCHKPTHHWFDCKEKPDGWKPARLAKRSKSPRLGMDEVTGLEAARQVATPMTGKTNPRKGQGTPEAAGMQVTPEMANESTAARMDVPVAPKFSPPIDASLGSAERLAGTQALPVDTNSSKAKRGRPLQYPDRKAYMAGYMRKRRAEQKAMKTNG